MCKDGLFVAALGNNTLEVVDMAAGQRLHSITGLREPRGIVYLASRNGIFVANGEDGKRQDLRWLFDRAAGNRGFLR